MRDYFTIEIKDIDVVPYRMERYSGDKLISLTKKLFAVSLRAK
jgi:hypothetical protein